MDEYQKHDKYNVVALCSITIMFVAFLFILMIFYMQSTTLLDQLSFDVNTVTASDYTVEMDISLDMWEDFRANQLPFLEKELDKSG